MKGEGVSNEEIIAQRIKQEKFEEKEAIKGADYMAKIDINELKKEIEILQEWKTDAETRITELEYKLDSFCNIVNQGMHATICALIKYNEKCNVSYGSDESQWLVELLEFKRKKTFEKK